MMIRSPMLMLVAIAVCTAPCSAHFPFLASEGNGHVVMWFGSSVDDRTYAMPEQIKSIELFASDTETPLATSPVETDSLVGIRSDASIPTDAEVYGTTTYGLYHGTKLTYHVEHLPQSVPNAWPNEPRDHAGLQTTIRPSADGGIEVRLLADGEPLAETKVKLFRKEGAEGIEQTTDSSGSVRFGASDLQSGLNVLMVGVQDSEATGTYDGQTYASTTDYLTATFFHNKPASETMSATIEPSGLADLPAELTSFGAAISDGKLYVYGGHTGSAHSYSTAEQSKELWCLDLSSKSAQWKQLAVGPRLQGLAMVAHNGRVIRIGGFTAMNAEGEESDLRSQAGVAAYDPATDTWSDLPPLPEPRSSFDAAVIGDTVYVVGGWQLAGDSEASVWHSTAWKMDLSRTDATWQPIAAPEFQRRAVSVAAHDGRLYVIGGMQSSGKPTTEVAVYDPASDRWSAGPNLPGEAMAGFGTAAFDVGGRLIVTTMSGNVVMLAQDAAQWQQLAKLEPARFFHRVVPADDQQLLVIGGANMEVGKFTLIETIRLDAD